MIIDPKAVPQAQLHGYLLAAVAPRPIAFASTINSTGEVNLSPFSFFNVFSSNPPVMIFSPARRGRDNTTKDTLHNVSEVPEVVINIVNYPMVEQMSLASSEYPSGVNEFVKAGFTAIPSATIRPPRVGEAPVAFECAVQQIIALGNSGGAGNLIICEVKLIHIQDQYIDAAGQLDTTRLDLIARMGANWYCRANGAALFEIPKPLAQPGVGVDALPAHARESHVLTGNDLGRLGNVPALPDAAVITDVVEQYHLAELSLQAIHELARRLVHQGDLMAAWAVLLGKD
jgi:flavin reductase (DIM6/NTAB) family NADH-FMN oxidoreductase RutF